MALHTYRTLLQLSALCQRTYDCSDVITSLLTQLSTGLEESLGPDHTHTGKDHTHTGKGHTHLEWQILLLSHILASLSLKTTSKSHPNLFQPSPLKSTAPPDNSSAWELNRAAANQIHDRKMQFRQLLADKRSDIKSTTATGEMKAKLVAEFEALKKVSKKCC